MNKRILLLPVTVVCLSSADCSQNIEEFLRPYAEQILIQTKFELTDKDSGETFQSTNDLGIRGNLAIESEFLDWRYTSALVYDGLRELGTELNEERYINFGKRAFAFFFDNKPYYEKIKSQGHSIDGLENFVRFKGVWNDGAQTAALVDVCMDDKRSDYLNYMEQVAEFFFNDQRSPDNKPSSLNIDQIYTKGVFMARMGRLTGEPEYFDYCVKEVQETERLFYDERTGLYNQYYYTNLNVPNNIKWLRGIGWATAGIVNVLVELPEEHPGYEDVLRIYQKMVIGISAYQAQSGLWRHLVDRQDCFEETSGSTYVVYAIARGINEGLLDPVYRDVAMAGWHGITSMQDDNGKIRNVTTGVSGSTSPSYYYSNEFDSESTHLFGPLFLAGAEMIKLYRKYDKPKVRDWDFNVQNE